MEEKIIKVEWEVHDREWAIERSVYDKNVIIVSSSVNPDLHISKEEALSLAKHIVNFFNKNISQSNARSGQDWTEDEDKYIRTLFSEGKHPDAIAEVIERAPWAVEMRLRKLNVE